MIYLTPARARGMSWYARQRRHHDLLALVKQLQRAHHDTYHHQHCACLKVSADREDVA